MAWAESAIRLRSEISDRGDLAAREPRGAKRSGAECQDGFRGEIPVEQRDKSAVDGSRRGAGKLLIEDALGECRKVGLGRPREAENLSSVDQPGHDPIAARYCCDRSGKGVHHVA